MNKQEENKRDLGRLKCGFCIIILALAGAILYGGLEIVRRNIQKTADSSIITILAMLGLYAVTFFLGYVTFNVILPKTEKEKAIYKATKRIEAEYSLKKAQERLKKLK